MLKLLAALLLGGLFLTSSGCCWPIHDGYHRGGWGDRGGWDDRGSYGYAPRPEPRPRAYPRAPAPGRY
jgi:hypothetical protein